MWSYKLWIIFSHSREAKYFVDGFKKLFQIDNVAPILITDRDTVFTSKLCQNLYTSMGIHHSQRAGGIYQ